MSPSSDRTQEGDEEATRGSSGREQSGGMGTVRGQDTAHMFFPGVVPLAGAPGGAQRAAPAMLTLAGDAPAAKTALLLQYAYNAALRGASLCAVVVGAAPHPCARAYPRCRSAPRPVARAFGFRIAVLLPAGEHRAVPRDRGPSAHQPAVPAPRCG